MIRSGSTLQYNLVTSLVDTMGTGVAHGGFRPQEFETLERQFAEWQRTEGHHVFKTHHVASFMPQMVQADLMRIVYVFRDLRDVAASLQRAWNYSDEKTLAALSNAVQRDDEFRRMGVLCQKYEHLRVNTRGALAELAAYLDLDPPPGSESVVLQQCSLENTKRTIRRIRRNPLLKIGTILRRLDSEVFRRVIRAGRGTPVLDLSKRPRSLWTRSHISTTNGRPGVWKDWLKPGVIVEIERQFGNWLESNGYPLSSSAGKQP